MKITGEERASMDLIAAQKAIVKEGETHLRPILLRNYATNRDKLSAAELKEVVLHLENGCERCEEQISKAQIVLKF